MSTTYCNLPCTRTSTLTLPSLPYLTLVLELDEAARQICRPFILFYSSFYMNEGEPSSTNDYTKVEV